jgi:predicted lipoprotein with Yx(FWY)xxD motif
VAIVLAGACGSSGAKYGASSGTTPTSNAPTSSTAIVETSHSSKLGDILTDAKGMTLYTLTSAGKPVACTGPCATVWPPLLLPAGVTTPSATGVSGVATVSMNGGPQVTHNGDPLYRFSGDAAPGNTHGEGINSFGGIWHAAPTTVASSGTSPMMTPPTTTGGYNNGGYNNGG